MPHTNARGTTNKNERGNTRDRAARRAYLIKTFASDVSPLWCRCYRCGVILNKNTVTVDRIVPGSKGGKYTRNNIRPSCSACASVTGGKLAALRVVR